VGALTITLPTSPSLRAVERRYKSFLNASIVKPASTTIPPIVKALIGFALGIVIIRSPFGNMFSLPGNPEAGLLKVLDCALMVDAGEVGHITLLQHNGILRSYSGRQQFLSMPE